MWDETNSFFFLNSRKPELNRTTLNILWDRSSIFFFIVRSYCYLNPLWNLFVYFFLSNYQREKNWNRPMINFDNEKRKFHLLSFALPPPPLNDQSVPHLSKKNFQKGILRTCRSIKASPPTQATTFYVNRQHAFEKKNVAEMLGLDPQSVSKFLILLPNILWKKGSTNSWN